jgi:hypothetical protein
MLANGTETGSMVKVSVLMLMDHNSKGIISKINLKVMENFNGDLTRRD